MSSDAPKDGGPAFPRDDGKSTVSGYVREMAAMGVTIDPKRANAVRELISYVGAEASRKARSLAIDDAVKVVREYEYDLLRRARTVPLELADEYDNRAKDAGEIISRLEALKEAK